MRRPSALLIALALAAPPIASAQDDGLRLTEAADTGFPSRAFVLTVPRERSLAAADVELLENGVPVPAVSVTPAAEAKSSDLGVVLVIDASRSMKGKPIESAMAAARQFARRRNPRQPLAVIAFNSAPTVLVPLTTDASRIERTLAEPPPLGRETHVHDAVVEGVRLLSAADVAAGSVVVLSDGDDTGSVASAAEAASAARGSEVRVFTVGLRSGAFVPAELERLAARTGGTYSDASSPARLTKIYDELGTRLASEYLVRYRSLAGPNEEIAVEARIEGVGSATTGYRTPPLPVQPTPPFERSAAETFWRSPLAILLISVLAGIPLALIAVALARPRAGDIRTRLAGFISAPSAGGDGRLRTEQMLQGAERSLERSPRWAAFKEELEIARIEMPAIQVVAWTAVGTIATLWLVLAVVGQVLLAPLALAVPLGVRMLIKRKLQAQRLQFSEQLVDNLQVLASAIRAGHSLVGAMSVVMEEAAEPSRAEFRRVVTDEQLGVPLEEALLEVSRRMDTTDLEQVAVVAALQRDTGGNTAEVLERVSTTVRARFELRRLVATLTAQGRLSRWVVTALPPFLLLVITAINPEYMEPLYETGVGRAVLLLAALMTIAGSLVIKRIVDIEM